MSEEQSVLGRVVAIWRYPVKSMAAEALSAVDVSWHGVAGDRRWAFVRPGLERSGFPWLTIRERSDLWRFEPSFADPARPEVSTTHVRTPSGETFDVTDPALGKTLPGRARASAALDSSGHAMRPARGSRLRSGLRGHCFSSEASVGCGRDARRARAAPPDLAGAWDGELP